MHEPVFDIPAHPAADAPREVAAGLPGRAAAPRRRGRPGGKPAPGVGAEIRRQRDVLGLTLRQAAGKTKVSATVMCQIERGTRIPSLRTYEKLRDGLGLTEPAATLVRRRAPDIPADDRYRATLAACVVTAQGVVLTELAAAMGVSIPAVREGLSVLDDRLAHVGLTLLDDGVTVRVAPLAFAHAAVDAVTHIGAIPKLTERQLTILCFVAYAGATTLPRIERMCDSDCESLLARMVDTGLLACTRDHSIERAPNLYRLTTTALLAVGYPTIEAFREAVLSQLDEPDLARAQQLLTEGNSRTTGTCTGLT